MTNPADLPADSRRDTLRAMRIIAGTHRGRRLLGPKDTHTTRPITDRVKQSLFDRLEAHGLIGPPPPQDVADSPRREPAVPPGVAPDNLASPHASPSPDHGGHVLDLFCGTGSLGLEALSRGAASCLFVEQDDDALQRLRRNIADLGLDAVSHVVRGSALVGGWRAHAPPEGFRVVFVDPPYRMLTDDAGWQRIAMIFDAVRPHLEPEGVLMLRTERHVDLPAMPGWRGPRVDPYGSMQLCFFARAANR